MEPRPTLRPGTSVYSADGELIGTIESADEDGIVIDGSRVPSSAIALSREGEIQLSVTAQDARDGKWTLGSEAPPAQELEVEPGSDYTAIQGEDSLEDDPMATPGNGAR